jgi:translation initiation factor 2B subunit (eIF-2B alpha/beta/delta family)
MRERRIRNMSLGQESIESMMKAISTIAESYMNSISYDETIICTIVDDSHAKQEFYYTVTDGSIRFDAYVTSVDKPN